MKIIGFVKKYIENRISEIASKSINGDVDIHFNHLEITGVIRNRSTVKIDVTADFLKKAIEDKLSDLINQQTGNYMRLDISDFQINCHIGEDSTLRIQGTAAVDQNLLVLIGKLKKPSEKIYENE